MDEPPGGGHAPGVIRALIVDDHPALLTGLVRILRSEPGIVPAASAGGVRAALAQAERDRPDVAIIDYHLADGDGLTLVRELDCLDDPPATLIYSGLGHELGVAAAVAGAAGVVDKSAPLDDLLDAIRTVARGGCALPPLTPTALERSAARLDPEDLPILGMRVDGATLADIAAVLHQGTEQIARRLNAMLPRLTGAHEAPSAVTLH